MQSPAPRSPQSKRSDCYRALHESEKLGAVALEPLGAQLLSAVSPAGRAVPGAWLCSTSISLRQLSVGPRVGPKEERSFQSFPFTSGLGDQREEMFLLKTTLLLSLSVLLLLF